MLIAGVDEAGRGPLAGPVVAAAVIFQGPTFQPIYRDSKKLSAKKRDLLFDELMASPHHIGVGVIHSEEIDRVNILQATFLAMKKAVEQLPFNPHLALIDGNKIVPGLVVPQKAIVKGDDKVPLISAASIIAKVTRDRLMEEYDRTYPVYGFRRHKGYGTKYHMEQIFTHGLTPIHRRSFNTSNQLTLWKKR
jgi:ribonuclease HII